MHCMACDAEMILMQVVPDETMPVAGFEWRTFSCPACHDVERRLAFSKHDAEPDPVHTAPSLAEGRSEHEPIPLMDMAPSLAPAAAFQDAPAVAPSLFRRVVARMRHR